MKENSLGPRQWAFVVITGGAACALPFVNLSNGQNKVVDSSTTDVETNLTSELPPATVSIPSPKRSSYQDSELNPTLPGWTNDFLSPFDDLVRAKAPEVKPVPVDATEPFLQPLRPWINAPENSSSQSNATGYEAQAPNSQLNNVRSQSGYAPRALPSTATQNTAKSSAGSPSGTSSNVTAGISTGNSMFVSSTSPSPQNTDSAMVPVSMANVVSMAHHEQLPVTIQPEQSLDRNRFDAVTGANEISHAGTLEIKGHSAWSSPFQPTTPVAGARISSPATHSQSTNVRHEPGKFSEPEQDPKIAAQERDLWPDQHVRTEDVLKKTLNMDNLASATVPVPVPVPTAPAQSPTKGSTSNATLSSVSAPRPSNIVPTNSRPVIPFRADPPSISY